MARTTSVLLVASIPLVLVAALAANYSREHCAPWEILGRSDQELAYRAAACASPFGGVDFKGAESHVDTIDNVEVRREAEHAVDLWQTIAVISAVRAGRIDEAREALNDVDDLSLREIARTTVLAPPRAYDDYEVILVPLRREADEARAKLGDKVNGDR